MADCRTIPPPRVTSRHTQASLRVSALRSSLVPALPIESICSTSWPSRTSTVFPNRLRRLANPWASVDLPEPLIPVNQTVKPLDEVPRFMILANSCLRKRRTILAALHSGKEYARAILKSKKCIYFRIVFISDT